MADINVIVLPDGTEYSITDFYLPVAISNPTAGQVLKYDATNQVWYNGEDASGSSILYGTSAPTSQLGTDGNLYVKYTEGTGGASDTVDALYVKLDGSWCEISTGGGGGTSDYNDLTNKPQINSVELSGNKSLDDLGIQPSEISKTATGSIVTFSDGGDNIPVESFECEINPVQDLHGYDHPWPAGGGKNLVPFSDHIVSTASGMTLTEVDNSGIKISGQPTLYYAILTPTFNCSIASGTTITLSITQALTHRIYIQLTFTDSTTDTLIIETGSLSATMTLTKEVSGVRLDVSSLSTSTTYNETIYVMLEKGSTASAYEPYENICPISGHAQADIPNAEKYIRVKDTNPQTYTQNGITIKTHSNGKIELSGTATANTTIYVNVDEFIVFSENSRTIKFNNNFTGTTTVSFIYNNTVIDGWGMNTINRQCTNFSALAGETINQLAFTISNGDTITDGSLMIEFIVTDTSTTYTVAFGQTIYGGKLIYANGKWFVRATHGYVELNGTENLTEFETNRWRYNTGIALVSSFAIQNTEQCSHFTVANTSSWSGLPQDCFMVAGGSYIGFGYTGDFNAYALAQYNNGTPIQLSVLLATPLLIPLTSTAKIKTLPGVNNIFSNTGDSTVKYFTNDADGIEELINVSEPKITYTERVLWLGPATPGTSGSDITLSDAITNYDEIVFDLTSENGRKYQASFLVSSLTIGSTYLETMYAAESQGVFWTYINETSINIKRITTGSETTITYNKIVGVKYGDVVKKEEYHKYSTDERVVGEWIDGKTLYEKTYTFTSPSSNAFAREDLGIPMSGISNAWIDAQNSFAKTSGMCSNVAFYDGNSTKADQFGGYLNFLQTNLTFDYRVGSDLYSSNVFLTIRYTKSS